MSIIDSLLQQKTDKKWVVELLTNVRFTVCKTTHLLGCSSDLKPVPDFVKKNKALYVLATDKRTGQLFSSLGLNSWTMHLNLSGEHISYIHNLEQYSNAYQCKFCEKIWPTFTSCKCRQFTCENKNKYVSPGGFLLMPKFTWDFLEDVDVGGGDDGHYPLFIIYDFEAVQPPVDSE